MIRLIVLGVLMAAAGSSSGTAVIAEQATPAHPSGLVAGDQATAAFLQRARAAMGLKGDQSIRTLLIEGTRWRSTPAPEAQIGTPTTLLRFPDKCRIQDGLTHTVAGETFWQVPVPTKGTPPRAKYNISRRCAVDALAFALQGFAPFPFTAKFIGTWNEPGLAGEAVDFRTPDDYRVVMVFDGATHRRIGLVEYGEVNGVPTPRVSRFADLTHATSGLEWPGVLYDTITTTALELRVTKVEVNANVEARVFRRSVAEP